MAVEFSRCFENRDDQLTQIVESKSRVDKLAAMKNVAEPFAYHAIEQVVLIDKMGVKGRAIHCSARRYVLHAG